MGLAVEIGTGRFYSRNTEYLTRYRTSKPSVAISLPAHSLVHTNEESLAFMFVDPNLLRTQIGDHGRFSTRLE